MINKKHAQTAAADFQYVVVAPAGLINQSMIVAASRAGALGILDLEYVRDKTLAQDAFKNLTDLMSSEWGIKLDGYAFSFWSELLLELPIQIRTVILTYSDPQSLALHVKALHQQGLRVFLEVTSKDEACAGEKAEVDGIIAKGNEAGGRIAEESTFILLQQLLRHISLPVWAHGGIGLHTGAACYTAGAAGIVLDWQLALVRESSLPEEIKKRLMHMDGTEPQCVGQTLGQGYRMYARAGASALAELRAHEFRLGSIAERAEQLKQWRDLVVQQVANDHANNLLLLGQDIAFASVLSRRFHTVAGVLDGMRRSIISHCEAAKRLQPLKEDAALAKAHGTKYPIVQGPMNRISDMPAFALSVAEGGGLPFIAIGMMTVEEIEPILKETTSLLRDRPWGVGLLGFISEELLKRQMELIRKFRPRFALFAGGRPVQARALEAEGITSYLHVPSPGLLRLFLEEGIKHFIFEGRECGGHIGPLSSFVLWETSAEILLEMIPANAKAEEYHVLFAGGINDALSSAMVATIAALLAERGVRVGLQLGTSYLFTKEALETGAVCLHFQKAFLDAKETVVIDSGGGHAIRCIASNFVRTFENAKRRLITGGTTPEEMRIALEQLSVGRLRIAAKGIAFNPECLKQSSAPMTRCVSEKEQSDDGLYMAGQGVALHENLFTIRQLHEDLSCRGSDYLQTVIAPQETGAQFQKQQPSKVAIVGMSCILPKAKDLKTYWENIINKVNAITEIPAERWDWKKYYDPDQKKKDKAYSKWGGFLDPIAFEPTDYGMPPNSMRSIDPNQVLALEAVRRALGDAGYLDREFDREHTSVIFGASGGLGDQGSLYSLRSLLPLFAADIPSDVWKQLPEWTEDSFPGLLLNVIAGRIANNFNLGGVNFSVDAACASSLAAIYHAVRELTLGSSSMVVVGGVDTVQNPFTYLCFSKSQALSPTGEARTFDANANGIVISEGVACVVLKRLEDAERDGDRIYAVIDGISGSSDGKGKSLTAPLPEGQVRALQRAYESAGVSPDSVELIEAHGTGTIAGDRAEATSLDTVFKSAHAKPQSCAVGSVKSMIGHTKAVAGIAGLIKVALSLYHKVLPPTLGVKTPNPHAIFNNGPLYVNTQARPWINSLQPCRAGVSAFGFGGTNFHAVLEEYGKDLVSSASCALETLPSELFCWVGNSVEELLQSIEPLERALERGVRPKLRDLAYTVDLNAIQNAKDTPAHALRLAIVAVSVDDLKEKLRQARQELRQNPASVKNAHGIYFSAKPLVKEGKVAFLFPGQGSQRPDMLRDLTIIFPEMRQCFSKADQVLFDRLPKRLSEFIFPPPAFTAEEEKARLAELTKTDIAQPALAATEMGMLGVLTSFGIVADMVAGHSSGEYAALAAAGVFSQESLYDILHSRGTAILETESQDLGTMLAVMASPDDIEVIIYDMAEVYMANFNSPAQTVLSASKALLQEAKSRLEARGITCQFIPVNCAFHSPYMKPARSKLAHKIASIHFNKPSLSLYSNSLAAPYPTDKEEMISCLSDHLIGPVRFKQEIETMYRDGARIFVEVGPRNVLTNLTRQILAGKHFAAIACNSSAPEHDSIQFHHALAQLFAEGVAIKLERLFHGREAKPLNLQSLDAADDQPSIGPTTWMVASDCAWPAREARPIKKQIPWGEPVQTAITQAFIAPPAPPSMPSMVVPSIDSNKNEVMVRHQKLMGQFLEQQREIMLTYLYGAAAKPKSLKVTAPASKAQNVVSSAPVKDKSAESVSEVVSAEKKQEQAPRDLVTQEDMEKLLVSLTAERTGYPPEMLGLDLNMEADLGIDSIKRVEILTAFRKKLPNAPADLTENLTAIKSLRDLINQVAERYHSSIASVNVKEAAVHADILKGADASKNSVSREEAPPRCLLSLTQHELTAVSRIKIPDGVVVITDNGGKYAEALQAKIQELGGSAVIARLATATRQLGENEFNVDLTNPTAVAVFTERLRATYKSIGGVVHLLPLREVPHSELLSTATWQRYFTEEVKSFFYLLRAAAIDLKNGRPKWVIGCTKLGGECGDMRYPTPTHPWRGGIIGIVKTVMQEWTEALCKSIDTDEGISPQELVAQLVSEIQAQDGQSEVYYRSARRWISKALQAPLQPANGGRIKFNQDDVILVTGGARGITSLVACELARRYQPTIILAGRSQWPQEESLVTAAITSSEELKKTLINHLSQGGKKPTPREVELAYDRIIADREMRATKCLLEEFGSTVFYHQVDVRDDNAFIAFINTIYKTHGRLDGVINGAGVIEDKLLEDKTPESFDRVFDTKVRSSLVLSAHLKPESLKFLVFFSSIAGSFGNRGQSDYSAANEVLNRLAQYLDARWPGRVVAINWGPWEKTGMANPALQRHFIERGIIPINPTTGSKALFDELSYGEPGQSLVVVGNGPWVKGS